MAYGLRTAKSGTGSQSSIFNLLLASYLPWAALFASLFPWPGAGTLPPSAPAPAPWPIPFAASASCSSCVTGAATIVLYVVFYF